MLTHAILGSSSNALSILRGLSEQGFSDFLIVDNNQFGVAFASNIPKKNCLLQETTVADVSKALVKYLDSKQKIVFYPTSDLWVDVLGYLHLHLDDTGKYLFYRNSSGFYSSVLDKFFFYQVYRNQFAIPETKDTKPSDLALYVRKPRFAFDEGLNLVKKGFAVVGDIAPERVWQRRVSNDLNGHYSICGISIHGQLGGHIQTRKVLEYPSPGGTATVVFVEEENEALVEEARKFLKISNYSGIFELEFIVTESVCYLIDFNARFWLQHQLTPKDGVPFLHRYLQGLGIDSDCTVDRREVWIHEGFMVSVFRQPLLVLKVLATPFLRRTAFAHISMFDPKPFFSFC